MMFIAYLASSPGFTETAWASDMRYEWPLVPSAAHYSGTYQIDDETTMFRTNSHWLMLEQTATVKIKAIASDGKPLMSFTLKSPTGGSPQPSPKAEAPPPRLQAMAVPTQGDKVRQEPAYDQEKNDDEVTSNVLERGDPAPAHGATVKRATLGMLAVNAALGHESIRAAGGITDYSAAALVAGVQIDANWQNSTDYWYLAGSAELHRLNVSERVMSTTGAADSQTSSTFLRTFTTAGIYYDLRNGTSVHDNRVGVGIGVAYLRLPMLKVQSGSTEGHLTQQSALGPFLGVDLSTPWLNRGRLGISGELMPTSFVRSTQALAVHIQGAAIRPFAKHWSSLLKLDFERQFLARNGDCPAITNCVDEMTANATVVLISAGVAYQL
jgi:hypothetical protein